MAQDDSEPEPTEEPSAEAGEQAGPVIVIAGGYDSCVRGANGRPSAFGGNFNTEGVKFVNEVHDKFAAASDRTPAGRSVRWVFTCFNKMSELYVQDNSDTSIVQDAAWDLSKVMQRIERQSENYARPVFVVGHSHGGWLAMRIIESMRKPLVNGYLATLDPISFVECNASTFAEAIALTVFLPGVAWNRLAPCRRAPGDISNLTLRQIRSIIPEGSWRNYYQTNFIPLHSGPMNGPDHSMDMSPFFSVMHGGAAKSFNAHIRLSTLSSIWYSLRVSLYMAYGME